MYFGLSINCISYILLIILYTCMSIWKILDFLAHVLDHLLLYMELSGILYFSISHLFCTLLLSNSSSLNIKLLLFFCKIKQSHKFTYTYKYRLLKNSRISRSYTSDRPLHTIDLKSEERKLILLLSSY